MSKTTTTDAEDQNDDIAGWCIKSGTRNYTTEEGFVIGDAFPSIYKNRKDAEWAATDIAQREHPTEDLVMEKAYINVTVDASPCHHTTIKNGNDEILYSVAPVEYSES